MGATPLITAVLPARNEERGIAWTLGDLAEQDYPSHELLVVDNASDDRTGEIAARYADRVIREADLGYIHAVTRGVAEARGEIIAFCDADTRYQPDWLSRIAAAFGDPDVVAVYGPYTAYNGPIVLNRCGGALVDGVMRVSRRLGAEYTSSCNLAVRKDAYRRCGGYDLDGPGRGDLALGRRLREQGRVLYLPEIRVRRSFRGVRRIGARAWLRGAVQNWLMLVRDSSDSALVRIATSVSGSAGPRRSDSK
jgi:glycosyltransferase involved in cell wall biosynthesis